MNRWLLILGVSLLGCEDLPASEPESRHGPREHGALMLWFTGLELIDDPRRRDFLREGYTKGYINHPIDDAGEREATHLDVVLHLGAEIEPWLTPASAWDLGYLRVRLRQSEATPLGTRTLFTEDVQPPVVRFEEFDPMEPDPLQREACDRDTDCPSGTVCGGVCGTWQRYEGAGELEVFATDLKTGATWGRLKSTLHALDSDDGPYTLETEFAAITSLACYWEEADPGGIEMWGTRYVDAPPEGRADDCTAALAAIDAAEAHPDGPPLPPFVPNYWGTTRPIERWSGLDR